MSRGSGRWLSVAALSLAGCYAPVLSPVHPMTALSAAPSDSKIELAGAVGYAAVPGAGLGDSIYPGSPYAEGEIRYAVLPQVQLQASAGLTFQSYFLPWPGDVGLGAKLVAFELPELSIAFAPRVTYSSAFTLGQGSPFLGTRSEGLEVPALFTHRFSNDMALTLELWGRGFLERQHATSSSDKSTPPIEDGHTLTAGGALAFSFPRHRGSLSRYHVFLGGEELWLTQTGEQGEAAGGSLPLVTLNRFSLLAGLGVTTAY